MRYILVIVTVLVTSLTVQARQEERKKSIQNWATLSQVEFVKSNDGYAEIYLPEFSPLIESKEGKEIILQGYIVPNDGLFSAEEFIISSLPLAQCFFCGGDSGPESVAYVYPKKPVVYTAKLVTITGLLKLNRTDSNNLIYMVEDADIKEAE
ncbi:MAG: hypothetical protein AAFQ94_10830 [Bacteroidota bacterium]